MSWKVRHQGSPQAVEGLSPEEVTRQLLAGLWEPTDEVMGPDDPAWVAFENHPRFAETAAELEPPQPRVYDDDTHLDMTPLIDVTMVLLIFFILIRTYFEIDKAMPAPETTRERIGKLREVTKQEVDETMVPIRVSPNGERAIVEFVDTGTRIELFEKKEDGKTIIEGKAQLLAEFERYAGAAKRRKVLIRHDPKGLDGELPFWAIVTIQDNTAAAGFDEVLSELPPQEGPAR